MVIILMMLTRCPKRFTHADSSTHTHTHTHTYTHTHWRIPSYSTSLYTIYLIINLSMYLCISNNLYFYLSDIYIRVRQANTQLQHIPIHYATVTPL
jgi:hypothetical protein